MKSAQPAGLPQKLALRIERAILHNEYQPGARLPTERTLAQRWKASRSTVREALSLLVAKGMLTRRQGDGTYVNDSTQRLNIAVWSDMAQHHPDLQADLLEFRHMLECRTAQLAALRHDAQDRKKLESAAAAVDAAYAGSDPKQQLDSDFAFHRAIAEAAHNPLFAYLTTSLQALLHDNMRFSLAGLDAAAATHARALRSQHAALLKSILKRDAAAAATAATGHLDYVIEQINHLSGARVARL
jgi:GntR family transcriptional regulator, transcriptional repressor for pyruvate dehydrogenase complex